MSTFREMRETLQSRSECVVFPRQVLVIISKDSKCISTQRNALGVCVEGEGAAGGCGGACDEHNS